MRREDFATPAWKRLVAKLDSRIAELRIDNDAVTLTTEQTFAIRGRIDELKRILALGQTGASDDTEPGLESWPLPNAE